MAAVPAAIAPLAHWSLEQSKASANVGNWRFLIDAAQPRRGLVALSQMSRDHILDCLQFIEPTVATTTLQLVDFYSRGVDLIASYDQLAVAEVQPQLYWRCLQAPDLDAVGLQLLISMQTSLLNSRPQCSVHTSLHAERVAVWQEQDGWQETHVAEQASCEIPQSVNGRLTLFTANSWYAYVEIAYPDDAVTQTLDGGVLTTTLFSEHLEKGVIRRGRIAGWIVPSENAREVALELFARAKREPLPLTT